MVYLIQDKETNKNEKEINKMMNEVRMVVAKLMEVATEEERILFDKIYRSENEKVEKELGTTKELAIKTFMTTWTTRAMEERA